MKRITAFTMLGAIAVILIMILCSSCNTYQKQLNKWTLFSDAHPNVVAERCAKDYPVKETVGATVVDSTRKANNQNYSTKIDSILQGAALLKKQLDQSASGEASAGNIIAAYKEQVNGLVTQVQQLRQNYKPCKPDTVYKTQTVYRLDQAALAVCNNKLQVKNDSLNLVKSQFKDEKEKSASRLHWLLGCIGVLIGLGVITVFKFLGKL